MQSRLLLPAGCSTGPALSIKISLNFNYSQVPIRASRLPHCPTNEVQIFFLARNSRSKPEPEHFMLMTNAFISGRTKLTEKEGEAAEKRKIISRNCWQPAAALLPLPPSLGRGRFLSGRTSQSRISFLFLGRHPHADPNHYAGLTRCQVAKLVKSCSTGTVKITRFFPSSEVTNITCQAGVWVTKFMHFFYSALIKFLFFFLYAFLGIFVGFPRPLISTFRRV